MEPPRRLPKDILVSGNVSSATLSQKEPDRHPRTVTSSSPTGQLVGGDAKHKLCDGDLHRLPPALLATLMRQRRATPGGPERHHRTPEGCAGAAVTGGRARPAAGTLRSGSPGAAPASVWEHSPRTRHGAEHRALSQEPDDMGSGTIRLSVASPAPEASQLDHVRGWWGRGQD